MSRILALAACVAALGVLPACSDSPSRSDGPTPARYDVVGGDLQVGTVGAELPDPLVVRVLDAGGRPVAGVVVNFVVTAGGGSVFAPAAQTNAQGEARNRWTLGTVAGDTQRVEVRAVDATTGEAKVFATFRAVGKAATAAALSALTPTTVAGFVGTAVAESLGVKVSDAAGNGVPGITVTWSASAGSTVSPATATTSSTGIARTRWTLGMRPDSSYTVQASVPALAAVTFSSTPAIPASAVLEKLTPDPTVAVATPPGTLRVRLRLADGRPIAGAQVFWTGLLLANPVATVTASDGSAAVVLPQASQAATYGVTANVGAVAATFQVHITAGDPFQIGYTALIGEINTILGYPAAASTIPTRYTTVRVLDALGNPAAGAAVTFAVGPGGSVTPNPVVTDANGTATTTWTLGTRAGENTMTATVGGVSVTQKVGSWPADLARADIAPDTVYLAPGGSANLILDGSDPYGNIFRDQFPRGAAWIWRKSGVPIPGDGPVTFLLPGPAYGSPFLTIHASYAGTETITGIVTYRTVSRSDSVVVVVR